MVGHNGAALLFRHPRGTRQRHRCCRDRARCRAFPLQFRNRDYSGERLDARIVFVGTRSQDSPSGSSVDDVHCFTTCCGGDFTRLSRRLPDLLATVQARTFELADAFARVRERDESNARKMQLRLLSEVAEAEQAVQVSSDDEFAAQTANALANVQASDAQALDAQLVPAPSELIAPSSLPALPVPATSELLKVGGDRNVVRGGEGLGADH